MQLLRFNMAMLIKGYKPKFEKNSKIEHKEKQCVNTSVSEYMRKYGQGKIDQLPTDPRPEVNDPRDTEQQLNDADALPMGFDELDAMERLASMKDRYKDAVADIKATEKQKEIFLHATQVLDDPNASDAEKLHAAAELNRLEKLGKVTRARV